MARSFTSTCRPAGSTPVRATAIRLFSASAAAFDLATSGRIVNDVHSLAKGRNHMHGLAVGGDGDGVLDSQLILREALKQPQTPTEIHHGKVVALDRQRFQNLLRHDPCALRHRTLETVEDQRGPCGPSSRRPAQDEIRFSFTGVPSSVMAMSFRLEVEHPACAACREPPSPARTSSTLVLMVGVCSLGAAAIGVAVGVWTMNRDGEQDNEQPCVPPSGGLFL